MGDLEWIYSFHGMASRVALANKIRRTRGISCWRCSKRTLASASVGRRPIRESPKMDPLGWECWIPKAKQNQKHPKHCGGPLNLSDSLHQPLRYETAWSLEPRKLNTSILKGKRHRQAYNPKSGDQNTAGRSWGSIDKGSQNGNSLHPYSDLFGDPVRSLSENLLLHDQSIAAYMSRSPCAGKGKQLGGRVRCLKSLPLTTHDKSTHGISPDNN